MRETPRSRHRADDPPMRLRPQASAARLRVDESRRRLVVLRPNRANKVPLDVFKLADLYRATPGYASDFLRSLEQKQAPERHLSMWFRDKRGQRKSLDVAFDDRDNRDGRSRRDAFLRNIRKLTTELEGDAAFFFDNSGVYARVSRSIFDRWRPIELRDPRWPFGDTPGAGGADGAAGLGVVGRACRGSHRGRQRDGGARGEAPLVVTEGQQEAAADFSQTADRGELGVAGLDPGAKKALRVMLFRDS